MALPPPELYGKFVHRSKGCPAKPDRTKEGVAMSLWQRTADENGG